MFRIAIKSFTSMLICTATATSVMASPPSGDVKFDVANSPLSGGEGTVFNQSREAFAKPLTTVNVKNLRHFTFGNKIFNTNWVQAPASVTSLDGLGPTFNRVSCSGCHFKDGRGRPPLEHESQMHSMLLRLSIPGKADDGGPLPHPAYGGQLNPFAISDVPSEGRATIQYTEIHGQFDDGTPYSLRKPHYHFHDLAFGEMGDATLFSPRVAPAVYGLGLLEAIRPSTLLSLADPDDHNQDGISGRVNLVPNESGALAIGRFGWKSNVATLMQQNAGAALGDIGLTTSLNPRKNCPEPQKACQAQIIDEPQPDMSDKQLERLTFYTHVLSPPARRDVHDPIVKQGAKLFTKLGCAQCHIPQITTGPHPLPILSQQAIQPFSDLLLHDMGEGLADHRPDYDANGREWRTPPLWGIGLVKTVNKHSFFLHDGRARSLEEAILWHGGEGEAAKKAYKALPAQDRAALLRFLESL